MPAVMEAIDRMTTSEKLEMIDYLVSSISAAGDNLSPAWHERELRKTEARVASGIERPIPWSAAKGLSGEEVAKLFGDAGVFKFLEDFGDTLHCQSDEATIAEIDEFIKTQTPSTTLASPARGSLV